MCFNFNWLVLLFVVSEGMRGKYHRGRSYFQQGLLVKEFRKKRRSSKYVALMCGGVNVMGDWEIGRLRDVFMCTHSLGVHLWNDAVNPQGSKVT